MSLGLAYAVGKLVNSSSVDVLIVRLVTQRLRIDYSKLVIRHVMNVVHLARIQEVMHCVLGRLLRELPMEGDVHQVKEDGGNDLWV